MVVVSRKLITTTTTTKTVLKTVGKHTTAPRFTIRPFLSLACRSQSTALVPRCWNEGRLCVVRQGQRIPSGGGGGSSGGIGVDIGNGCVVRSLRSWRREPQRHFSQSSSRSKLKTIDQIRTRNRGGPFNLTAAILFVAAAAGLWAYFTYEKERMARKQIADQTKGMGKPKVGGPFQLIDQDGNPFSSDDMLGKYSLVYFGFTNCPDICPDELDKMALVYDQVVSQHGKVLVPLMITCDPARDNSKTLKEYLAEFHPDFIGLTGGYEMIKSTCKAYRVYFSTPSNVEPGQDYLVDHSIYFYLMDPEGDFVEAIGRNFTAEQAAKVIGDHIKDWDKPLKKEARWQ